MKPFLIYDWAGNLCFDGISFEDFDDAEAWLDEKLGDDYETDRCEYYILPVEPRQSRYLDPRDPRTGGKAS